MLPFRYAKKKIFLSHVAEIEFTMSSFKRYSFNNEFVVNTFFSSHQYARPTVQKQHVGNIGYVDEKKVVGNTFKTLILTHPFVGKGNYVQSFRKGNNFQNISSRRYLFFWPHLWKLTNLPNTRIFCCTAKKKWYIFFGIRNSTCPDQKGKKVIWIVAQKCFQKKKFQKQQYWIYVGWRWKKVAVKRFE